MIAIKNVLVGTDFSTPSRSALTYARELAARFGATLHVLHVVEIGLFAPAAVDGFTGAWPDMQANIEDDARRRLHTLLEHADKDAPPTVPALRAATSPAGAIVDYAGEHDIDLIVMGTHGHGGLTHLLMGSVAERVVRLAPCPVLTVRHPQHEFVHPDVLEKAVAAP